jgi:hypothetical protein
LAVIPAGDLLLPLPLPLSLLLPSPLPLFFCRHPERSEGSRRSPRNTNPSDFSNPTLPAFAVAAVVLVVIPAGDLLFSSPSHLFFAFLAQKTHVKSHIPLTHFQSATSIWRISLHQSGTIKVEIKQKGCLRRKLRQPIVFNHHEHTTNRTLSTTFCAPTNTHRRHPDRALLGCA